MQDRIKEIRDKVDKANEEWYQVAGCNGQFLGKDCTARKVIPFLLDALQEAQEWRAMLDNSQAREHELHDIMDYKDKRLAELEQQLQESQEENKLQEIRNIADFGKRTVDNDHLLLHIQHLLNELRDYKDRERVLREAQLKFMNNYCSNFKTLHQYSTVCHPPDDGQCGSYDACRDLDKELGQEGK